MQENINPIAIDSPFDSCSSSYMLNLLEVAIIEKHQVTIIRLLLVFRQGGPHKRNMKSFIN